MVILSVLHTGRLYPQGHNAARRINSRIIPNTSGTEQPYSGQGLGFEVTRKNVTLGRTPVDEGSALRRDLYLANTLYSQETKYAYPRGIRNRNPGEGTGRRHAP